MQTRLTEISARNAFTFKKLDAKLDRQGLVLVRGVNHDAAENDEDSASNGAAKSAIFEVLRHILFGSTARGIKGRDLVRAGSVAGYVGTLKLDRAANQFTIQQAIDHKLHGNAVSVHLNGEEQTHKKAKVRNQKYVTEEVLGMTEEQFDATCFISQEAAHPLVSGTGAECSAYLSATFGLEIYDELCEKLREQTKQADKQAGEGDAYEAMLKSAQDKLAQLGDIQQAKQDYKDANEVVKGLGAKVDRLKDSMAAVQLRYKRRQTFEHHRGQLLGYTVISPDLPKILHVKLDELHTRLRKLDRVLAEDAANKQQQRNLARKRLELAEIDYEIASISAEKLLDSSRTMQLNIKEAEDELARHIAGSGNLAKLQNLDGKQECPTCGQTVDAKHLVAELERARTSALAARYTKERLVALRESLDQTKGEITHASHLEKQRQTVSNELAGLIETTEDISTETIDEAAVKQETHQITLEIKEAQNDLAVVQRLNEYMDASKDSLPEIAAEQRDLAVALTKFQERLTRSQQTASEAGLMVRDAEQIQREIASLQGKLDTLGRARHENELRKLLIKALKKLKVRRLHAIVHSIQEALPPYVEAMFGDDDVRVEVDDENPESIERWCTRPVLNDAGEKTDTRVKISVKALSKGERARLRVAFIWAIRKLMRPERTLNILILDEADGGLDRQGLEAYAVLLEQLRPEYESIFVISHRRELSTVSPDVRWTIHKRGGVSTLEVE